MRDYALSIIDQVHARWRENADANSILYCSGFSIFYGPLRTRPALMFVGVNPGGLAGDFEDVDFLAAEKTRQDLPAMEYATETYSLATRTRDLFNQVGRPDLLASAVKTNLNFFRSRDQASMPTSDEAFCRELVFDMIRRICPRVLFCESIGVLDVIRTQLYPAGDLVERQTLTRDRSNGRLYVSYLGRESEDLPGLLVGVPHLSSERTRVSDAERNRIAEALKADLEGI